MATTAKRFVNAVLTGASATYYTATSVKAQIQAMTITNTTGGPVACTVYLIPSGGSPDNTNTVISAKSLAAGESYLALEAIGQYLETNGTIRALGNGLTMVSSGVEIT